MPGGHKHRKTPRATELERQLISAREDDMGTSTTHSPEHADLVHDVIPISWCLELLRQQSEQLLAHFNDTAGHGLNVTLPFLK